MISFAYYWKKELVRLANQLERRYTQKRWTFASTTALEKQVFVGAFGVRKLLESDKVSDSISQPPVRLCVYPIRKDLGSQKPKHFTHRYELHHGEMRDISIRDLMNQFIHSYYFSPFVPAGKDMVGIFFASDQFRKEGLYYATLRTLADLFRRIGKEILSKQEIDRLIEGRSLWGEKE